MSNDGERVVGAEEAEAKADLSQSQTDSKTSTVIDSGEGKNDLDAKFDELAKAWDKRVEEKSRNAQSAKDKEFANLRKELNEVKKILVSQAQFPESERASSNPVSRGNEEQEAATQSVKEMFVLAGLAADTDAVENTKEYISFALANGGNADVNKALSYLQALKPKGQTKVSEGAVAQSTANKLPEADLEQEFRKEFMGARGKGFAEGDRIRAKYREMGLNVDEIRFSL